MIIHTARIFTIWFSEMFRWHAILMNSTNLSGQLNAITCGHVFNLFKEFFTNKNKTKKPQLTD